MTSFLSLFKKWHFLLLIVFLFSTLVSASGLSGTYTIDPSKSATATNYTSFNDASSDLISGSRSSGGTVNGPGVSGAVIFKVANGTYYEQVEITAISGVSSSNTVTFRSALNDSSKVILTDSTIGTLKNPGFVLHLNNASFINFKGITLQRGKVSASATYYDHVIVVDNVCDSDTISNCRLIGIYTPGSSYFGYLVFSGYNSPFSSVSSIDNHNAFINNYMKDAYYGVYWEGNSSSGPEKGNLFDHNIMDSVNYYGFQIEYQEGLIFTNNKINMPEGHYGLFLSAINVSATSVTSLIANNFISVAKNSSSGNNAGIYSGGLNRTNIVNNNINMYGSAGTTYAAYIGGMTGAKNLNLYNNNFINTNKSTNDYALYGANFSTEDYNNLKSASKSLVYYNGTVYSKLSTWKASSTVFAKHDSSVNPVYINNSDLHISNPSLNGTGKALSYITTDIDGEARNSSTPDIGADEFNPITINPVIKAITKPDTGFCAGIRDVYIVLANHGYNTLTAVTLNWVVNGVAQSPYMWSGSLSATNSDTIKIGSYNFSSASATYKIIAYPDSANGTSIGKSAATADSISLKTGLSGIYSIDNSGKTSPDYTTLKAAAYDLNKRGVCGAIIFKIADGIYNESIELKRIAGTSPANTVSFQSASLDSSKVIIDTAWYGYFAPRSAVITLNGSGYINFSKLTIINNAIGISYGYADAVTIKNGANHIQLNNNVIHTSPARDNRGYAVDDIYGTIEDHINILNNRIEGGFYAIQLEGNGSPVQNEKGNVVSGNIIDSAWGYGIVAQYNDSLIITKNRIALNTCNYGMYILNGGSTKDTMLIANNFVRLLGNSGTGVIVNNCSPLGFYYNSIISNTTSVTYYALRIGGSSSKGVSVENNIIANYAGGYAIEGASAAISISDHNDLYTTGSTLGSWNSSTYSNLASWQAASGKDKNSISVNPNFKSVASNDLHLTSSSTSVFGKGIKTNKVSDDIDGQIRGVLPDIGADETIKYSTDASITAIDSPAKAFCSGNKNVYVRIYNAGKDSIKSLDISWTVDGVSMTGISWSGALAANTSASVKLGSLSFTAIGFKTVKAWSSNPNGIADSNPINDTIISRIGTGMSGIYTLGGTSPDFSSFREATGALSSYSVCGAVLIIVRDGIYNESVTIHDIPGASAGNTITFQSQSLDSNKVILDTAWAGGTYLDDRAFTLRFDGAKYVCFSKMSIINYTTTNLAYADVTELTHGASHNKLDGNIIGILPATTLTYGNPVYDDPATVESHNIFNNNVFHGGADIIGLAGPGGTAGYESGNIISHNYMDSSIDYGVLCNYQDSLAITSNHIFLHSGYAGIYDYNGGKTDTSYIVNNFVAMTWAYSDGLYSSNNALLNVLNNSIYVAAPNSYYAAYFTGTTANKVRAMNNIFDNESSGYSIYGDKNGLSASDYNDLYSFSSIGNWNGTTCSTLADWQASSKLDKKSQSGDPSYFDPTTGDLHLTPASASVRHKALHTGNVLNDIDGELRKAIPDIGADEVPVDSNNVGVLSLISPIAGSCGSANTMFGLKISNPGLKDESGFKLHIKVNGIDTSSLLIANPFKSGHDSIVYISFTPGLSTLAGGKYSIMAYTDLSTDGDNSNDTIVNSMNINAAPKADFGYTNACLGATTQFEDSSKAGAGAIKSWTWDLGNSNTSTISNPTAIYLISGTYNVYLKVTDANGCKDSITKSVIIDSLDAGFTYSYVTGTNTDYKLIANYKKYTSYSWDFGDGSALGSGDSLVHAYNYGYYLIMLTIKDKNNCSATFKDSLRVVITSISQEQPGFEIKLFPQPFTDNLNIEYSLDKPVNLKLSLCDMSGKMLTELFNSRQQEGRHKLQFNTGQYRAGMYLLRMQVNGDIITKEVLLVR
jgi:hypothetical protein